MDSQKLRMAILVGSEIVASAATIAIVIRLVGGQDGLRSLKMKMAKEAERSCMRRATFWANLASTAEHVYDDSRVVTL